MADRVRVPVSELIDVERIGSGDRAPTPRELREALPRGWALDDDNLHAHRDLRLFFREGWILLTGLFLFGAFGLFFLVGALPRGWGGLARLALLLIVILAAGGLVGPMVTRALHRRG